MASGRHRSERDAVPEEVTSVDTDDEELEGPFDIDDFDDPAVATLARLDLGSVLIPMPDAGQVQVEMNEAGVPSAVWVVTPDGRFTIAAYAAPKSAGLWREVASELAESLRKDAPKVSIEDGPWGREVVGSAGEGAAVVRFIGVDGYRWMVRCVVNGPYERMGALAEQARNALADTVVRRGDTPMPVRTPLPVQLPEPMAAQLAAAQQQAMAQQQQAAAQAGGAAPQQQQQPAPQQPAQTPEQPAQQDQPPAPDARRSTLGSAMQQLRTITGG
ncbi:hypothetical protein FHR72_001680 [Mycolicibacterium iranicum]|uniref:DUF3710 domain-containing protein n=1 Tax=Mycolicibacterium iranicum TaxID=912594 RepID=A0A839QAD8_MYCIR|nr:DUF3710 domain-containing protein [Mycolicibacterium iranicum]MBB2990212.1 hypothetical protein [Mycolicibacterium iranicum]